MPFERALPRSRAPVSVLCPHCGREALRNPGDPICPDCGQDSGKKTTALSKGVGAVAPAVQGFRLSPGVVIVLLIVAPSLLGAFFFVRGHGKAVTADRIRQTRQRLEIYAGENGGYPRELAAVERRYGPLGPLGKTDGWDRPLRYSVGKEAQARTESGETLFETCELRSAGRNGTFGDGDDVVWSGTAGR